MNYSVSVKVEPAAEPLTLVEAKLHLKVDVTADDDLIEGLIVAARQWSENFCRRSWVRRTLELRMDCFPSVILLPRGPVSSVTSVKYTDSGGSEATMAAADYQVDLYGTPPRIVPQLGVTWPMTKNGALNGVLIEYVAGYAPGEASPTDHAENVPQAVKAAMKLMLSHWYENRQAVVVANVQAAELPMAVKSLLAAYELRDFRLE
jgi:uncharacterized phiE125 gp8 family phage protein